MEHSQISFGGGCGKLCNFNSKNRYIHLIFISSQFLWYFFRIVNRFFWFLLFPLIDRTFLNIIIILNLPWHISFSFIQPCEEDINRNNYIRSSASKNNEKRIRDTRYILDTDSRCQLITLFHMVKVTQFLKWYSKIKSSSSWNISDKLNIEKSVELFHNYITFYTIVWKINQNGWKSFAEIKFSYQNEKKSRWFSVYLSARTGYLIRFN